MARMTIARGAPRQSRKMRRPLHQWQVRHRPFQIQPIVLAPVLPAETMEFMLFQARAVTDPILNPLVGWHLEYYFFYVKHRDLEIRDDLTAMALDPDYDTSSLNTAASTPLYHYGSTIPWASLCLDRVRDEYFRDESEVGTSFDLDGLPLASVMMPGWLDSVTNETPYLADDVNVDLNTDTNIMASEVERAMRMWDMLRENNLTDMDYEDYLRTFGVNIPKSEELHRPELIRYVRAWQYPSNTIDPTDGSPSSAVSWAVSERANKKRFFKEPGFVFGITCARPKVYFSEQDGAAAGLMSDFYSWLPAVLRGDLEHALKQSASGSGPLQSVTDDYYTDIRDLLLYGDQFINFSLASTDASLVALPTAALQKRYASETSIDALFVDSTGASGKNLVRQDGVAHLAIAGRQEDLTPRLSG